MTPIQTEEVFQFLAGYWYDREESDSEIIGEILSELNPDYLKTRLELIQLFLLDKETDEIKSNFIRKCVWRYFPPGLETPIKWLEDILLDLQRDVLR